MNIACFDRKLIGSGLSSIKRSVHLFCVSNMRQTIFRSEDDMCAYLCIMHVTDVYLGGGLIPMNANVLVQSSIKPANVVLPHMGETTHTQ